MSVPSYEQDFFAWSQAQAELLRIRRFAGIDVDHLVEELEAMGARERCELIGRLKVLLGHLLKWQFQAHLGSRRWEATIKEPRFSIDDLIDDNPSLGVLLDDQVLARAYRRARLLAVEETNLDESTFPPTCPYSIAEIRENGFYPA